MCFLFNKKLFNPVFLVPFWFFDVLLLFCSHFRSLYIENIQLLIFCQVNSTFNKVKGIIHDIGFASSKRLTWSCYNYDIKISDKTNVCWMAKTSHNFSWTNLAKGIYQWTGQKLRNKAIPMRFYIESVKKKLKRG